MGTLPTAVPVSSSALGLLGLLLGAALSWWQGWEGLQPLIVTLAATALPMWWAESRRLGLSRRPLVGPIPWKTRFIGLCLGALPWLVAQAVFSNFVPNVAILCADLFFDYWPLWLAGGLWLIVRPTSGDSLDVLGCWCTRGKVPPPWAKLRDLMVKAFFLPLMLTFALGWWQSAGPQMFEHPLFWFALPLALMYLVDTAFGTIGYLSAPRSTGAHIRSSNPYWDAWAIALLCYPPFWAWFTGIGVQYSNGLEWDFFFPEQSWLRYLWGGAILGLTAIYVWATVVFGPRFSNLTNRGIITHGPFRYFRHPAYLSKNITWWMTALPFMPVFGLRYAIFQSLALLTVNALYWARAMTEERHLLADTDYRRYWRYTAAHGIYQWVGWARQLPVASRQHYLRFIQRRCPILLPVILALITLLIRPGDPLSDEAQVLKTLRSHQIDAATLYSPTKTERLEQFSIVISKQGYSPISVDQIFPVASLNKPLAGLIALGLFDQNLLSPKDPVIHWLPELLIGAPLREELTVENLLSHRSGIRAIAQGDVMFDEHQQSNLSGPTCYEALKQIEALDNEHGRSQKYQNINFCVLQAVVEAATGKTYEELLLLTFPNYKSAYFSPSATEINLFCQEIARLGAAGGYCFAPRQLHDVLSNGIADNAKRLTEGLRYTHAMQSEYRHGFRIWPQADGSFIFSHFGYLEGYFSLFIANSDGQSMLLLTHGALTDPALMFHDLFTPMIRVLR